MAGIEGAREGMEVIGADGVNSVVRSSLFGEAEAPRGGDHAYVDAPPWNLRQKLLEEKTALGYSLSAHLFSVYERELAGFPRSALGRLSAGERVWMAGIVIAGFGALMTLAGVLGAFLPAVRDA
mgnify:CR=1 FL=1